MSEQRPKLSVVMIAYNHAKYIEQAVNCALMQETDFDYEIIIGEDCSTDRTREILIELQKKHSDKIRLILHPKNIGMINNFATLLNMAQGQYIALCEGDDYWTSPHKLQIQVNHMEAHPACRICFHSAEVIYEDEPGRLNTITAPPPNQVINFENWLKFRSRYPTYLATATIVFRSVNKPLPEWFLKLRSAGDWPLIVWLSFNGGNLEYIDRPTPMAVYRRHPGGVTHVVSLQGTTERRARLRDDLADHALVSVHLNDIQRKWLRVRFFNIHLILAYDYLGSGSISDARGHLFQAIYHLPLLSRQQLKRLFILVFRCYSPMLYRTICSFRHKSRVNS